MAVMEFFSPRAFARVSMSVVVSGRAGPPQAGDLALGDVVAEFPLFAAPGTGEEDRRRAE